MRALIQAARRVVVGSEDRANHRAGRAVSQASSRLGPEHWDARVNAQGHLEIGGCDAVELAKTYGTPLHVVDHARLVKNCETFRAGFAEYYQPIEVAYSYKTNPLPAVLKALHSADVDAEVISHFELWLALELGVSPERVHFNGPAKTEEALRLGLSRGIRMINLDGPGEIERVLKLAPELDVRPRVGIRVVTSEGWGAQFGFSIRTGAALRAFETLAKEDRIDASGLHVHLGTGIRDVGIYVRAVEEMVAFAHELRQKLGVKIRIFDLGGGFGVPTVKQYTDSDIRLIADGRPAAAVDPAEIPAIEEYGRRIGAIFEGAGFPEDARPSLLFEPGRALTSSAQTLLLEVLAIKPGPDGRSNVLLSGGKNVAIPLGYELHEVFAAGKMSAAADDRFDLYGPLCHPDDCLVRHKAMPALEPGDVVAVMDSGAYFIPNQMNFSNPRAAAVMAENGSAELIRSRESFEHVVALDRI